MCWTALLMIFDFTSRLSILLAIADWVGFFLLGFRNLQHGEFLFQALLQSFEHCMHCGYTHHLRFLNLPSCPPTLKLCLARLAWGLLLLYGLTVFQFYTYQGDVCIFSPPLLSLAIFASLPFCWFVLLMFGFDLAGVTGGVVKNSLSVSL